MALVPNRSTVVGIRSGLLRLMISCFMVMLALACSEPADPVGAVAVEGPAEVKMTVHGPVLTAPDGTTLYWWSRDEATRGQSQCDNTRHQSYRHVTGHEVFLLHPQTRKTCEQKWPPFTAADTATPQGEWSIIERHDNSRQWAYRGHPLHLSIKDSQPGEANGISIKEHSYGGWQPAMAPLDMPPGIELLRLREGLVLATADRRVLYTPDLGQAPCADCKNNPTPLVAGALVDRVGEWTVVSTSAGLRQYAFRGRSAFVGLEPVDGPHPQQIDGWQPIYFAPAVAVPTAIDIRFSLIGDIYTNLEGMALYVFYCEEGPHAVPCDDPGDAAAHWSIICGAADDCAKRLRPYRAATGEKPAGEWSILTVADPVFSDPGGVTHSADNDNPVVSVWAYRGRPVYTFADDDEPGQVLAHRIKGLPGSGFYALQAPGNHATMLSR